MSYNSAQLYNLLGKVQENQHDEGYQTQILNNYKQLLDTVSKENDILNSNYSKNWTLNSADGQQSKYITQSSNILASIYSYGFWIFMVLAIILCVIIWTKPDSIYYKIGLSAVVLTYPFYIYPLEGFLYMLSLYIWNLLLSNVYDNGYNNTSIKYGLNGSPGSFGSKGSNIVQNEGGGLDGSSRVNGANGANPPIQDPPSSSGGSNRDNDNQVVSPSSTISQLQSGGTTNGSDEPEAPASTSSTGTDLSHFAPDEDAGADAAPA